ncbi:hypothetical protein AAG570_013690 [Ranatra chinensis]|uniref:Uncharacterized protein n=1 Tax=Ranatra chinensis TaxID=642074 RepID=A0ABD0YDL0_9HEMI
MEPFTSPLTTSLLASSCSTPDASFKHIATGGLSHTLSGDNAQEDDRQSIQWNGHTNHERWVQFGVCKVGPVHLRKGLMKFLQLMLMYRTGHVADVSSIYEEGIKGWVLEHRALANYDSQEADMSREDETDEFYEKRKQERATEIEKFKTELEARKKTRTEVLANLSRQIETLRAEKQGETELRERAELEVEELKKRLGQDGPNIADELESLRLQLQESKLAWECEKNELEERALKAGQLEKQVLALKDVANIGKQILAMREKQSHNVKEPEHVRQEHKTGDHGMS